MKTKFRFLVLAALFSAAAINVWAGNYQVSNTSVVKWTGKKVVGAHEGTINLKSGNIEVDKGAITGGVFEMDMNSIVNNDLKDPDWNARLVGHLKSEDFFSVEKYPVSKFTLSKVEKKSGNIYSFSGNLSIKGITHPLAFEAVVDVAGKTLKATGQIKIDRTQYEIRYGSGRFFSNLGDNMIDDFFTLDFNISATENTSK